MSLRYLGSPARSDSHLGRFGAAVVLALAVLALVGSTIAIPSSQAAAVPIGSVDAVTVIPGGVQISGWAAQPGNATSLTVRITVSGFFGQNVIASAARPDVGAAYPGTGSAHGFLVQEGVGPGTSSICVTALGSTAVQIGCRSVTIAAAPFGSIDNVTQTPSGVHVAGWVLDPASGAPDWIAVTANGSLGGGQVANLTRPDIGAAYPYWGANHGFDLTFPLGAGNHSICVGANGLTASRYLGCVQLTVSAKPFGGFDLISTVPSGVQVAGWAIDPATTGSASIALTANGIVAQVAQAAATRTDIGQAFPGYGSAHGFSLTQLLGPGTYSICLTATDAAATTSTSLGCKTASVSAFAVGSLDVAAQVPGGIRMAGWALSPNSTAPLAVQLTVNGAVTQTVTANLSRADIGAAYPTAGGAHGYDTTLPLAAGTYSVCAFAVGPGGITQTLGCRTLAINFNPIGFVDVATRSAPQTLLLAGWAFDPDTSASINISYTIDGGAPVQVPASMTRSDIGAAFPGAGSQHGFSTTAAISQGEHSVCVTAVNVSFGADTALGCTDVIAVGATVPAAPGSPSAQAGFGTATVTWTTPNDGGAGVGAYRVTSSPGNIVGTTGANSIILSGFQPGVSYTFAVVAINVIGTSAAAITPAVTTFVAPIAETTTPPVSTSRYVRNLTGGASDVTYWHNAGAADAAANPSGHWYVSLLDIGGQSSRNGVNGVILSATSTWITNAQLVTAMNAYVDGYRSAQAPSAPVMIAIGTNNDSSVSTATGQIWANQVVNPIAIHLGANPNIEIAGANDIEPGFTATPVATIGWLDGFLSATGQPFVFNGSADGCNSAAVNGNCNNGWTASYLYQLSAGRAPSRMMALPQIYNTTMAAQWHFISATGVVNGLSKINFGGALTEVAACAQAGGSCFSLNPAAAWPSLFNAIQGDSRTALGTLPWVTDLRIN